MKERLLRLAGTAFAAMYFFHCAATPSEWHFVDGVNLIFHEAGHVLFMFCGNFIHVLMGSGFQVLLPLAIALYFFFTAQRLSSAICLMWVGQNLINVSIYAGDAIVMQLPLLGGDESLHDWHYLLSTLGILEWTPLIAQALMDAGLVTIFIGAGLSVWWALADGHSTRTSAE